MSDWQCVCLVLNRDVDRCGHCFRPAPLTQTQGAKPVEYTKASQAVTREPLIAKAEYDALQSECAALRDSLAKYQSARVHDVDEKAYLSKEMTAARAERDEWRHQLQVQCAFAKTLVAERDRAAELLREAAMNGNQTYRERINGDITAFLTSLQDTPK